MSTIVFVETTSPGIMALSTAKKMGHRVIFLTSSKFDWLYTDTDRAALRTIPDLTLAVDDTQDVDCLDRTLIAIQKSEAIHTILTVLQYCVQPVADVAHRHGLPFTSPEGVNNARDKGRCRKILCSAGIPSVRHAVVRTSDEALEAALELGYPLIIKPTTGAAKMLTTIVANEAELRSHFKRVDVEYAALNAASRHIVQSDFILEELAQGPLYSVELGASASGEWIPFVVMKRKLGRDNRILELGSTLPADLDAPSHAKTTDYAIDVCKTLGLDIGIFHVELIYSASGPILVEVNPRIGGGAVASLIKTATGQNIFEPLIDIHLRHDLGILKYDFKTAASHTFVGASEDCTIRTDLPHNWFDAISPNLSAGSVAISAGDKLPKMSGNMDVKGYLQVTADDHDAAVKKVNTRMHELERILGVSLMKSDTLETQDD